MKLCKDCKHFKITSSRCVSSNNGINPVGGKPHFNSVYFCRGSRLLCGEEGKWWEQRVPWYKVIFKRIFK